MNGESDVPSATVWLRLTPLGIWCANVLLRMAGAITPVIGELAQADVATLIEGLSGYGESAYRAELRAWCREHGPAAARELAGYARAAPGFDQRLFAFIGLREAGPTAEAEVRSMLADSELRRWPIRSYGPLPALADRAAPGGPILSRPRLGRGAAGREVGLSPPGGRSRRAG
jgi:hypothetical protein